MSFNVFKFITDFNKQQRQRERDEAAEKSVREEDKSGPYREGIDVDQWRNLKR